MFPAKEIADTFKAQAFARLDQGKGGKPKMLYVDANLLIDLCLAYESAAEGDVSNLEYIIKVLSEDKQKLMEALDKISDKVHVDSDIWELATNTGVY
jgi:hypothetical protein